MKENAAMSDAYLQNQSTPGHSQPVRETTVVYGRPMERKVHFSFRSPLFVPPYTHTTQQGTHVMHHAMISDSEVEVITSGSPLPFLFLPPFIHPSQWLDALTSAIDLVAGDNSFHRRDTP